MDAANQFGRGTPAGNAIYRLYHKKTMDSTLDPELLARVQKMRQEKEAMEAPPKPIPKSQAHVNVPKYGRRAPPSAEQIATAKLNAIGHRKRGQDIQEEVRAQGPPPPLPAPAKPSITDAEKEKLVQIFAFGAALPGTNATEHTTLSTALAAKSGMRKARTHSDVLESRFDEIRVELRQKREYLAEVQAGQAGGNRPADRKQLELVLTNEIASLVKEMKSIDEELKMIAESTPRQ